MYKLLAPEFLRLACWEGIADNLLFFFFLQCHIRVLETSQENISALLMGLEYLTNISYVDDTEVFKVIFSLTTSTPFFYPLA